MSAWATMPGDHCWLIGTYGRRWSFNMQVPPAVYQNFGGQLISWGLASVLVVTGPQCRLSRFVCMFCLYVPIQWAFFVAAAPVVSSSFGLGKRWRQWRPMAAGILALILFLCHHLYLLSWVEAGEYPSPNCPSASEQHLKYVICPSRFSLFFPWTAENYCTALIWIKTSEWKTRMLEEEMFNKIGGGQGKHSCWDVVVSCGHLMIN